MKCLVAGAGGFIGGHLVNRLLLEGHEVHAVDVKSLNQWHQVPWDNRRATLFDETDLAEYDACMAMCDGRFDEVYNLAADMGGMGFIETHKLDCMLSVLINTRLLMAARAHSVRKYFFASSACVYPSFLQSERHPAMEHYSLPPKSFALAEKQAYPADPEDGYGWEKLFSERMCRHFMEDAGLEVRIGRLHNVYGPFGTWQGGREKAPAAICRKVAWAKLHDEPRIEVWGDGEQTRSFMFIDDCIDGITNLMDTPYVDPVNIGSTEMVSINQLVEMVSEIAEHPVTAFHIDGPLGVRGRNSDNTLIKEVMNWEPSTPLKAGLVLTYQWIEEQVAAAL